MLLELKDTVVYGPVHSRRLGRSLGINLLPGDVKVCTFNCVYCQYGWTDASKAHRALFPAVDAVLESVADVLKSSSKPDYVTFSGNGEPTLHPEFPELVDGIIALRDRFAPGARTAILSNSTTAGKRPIRDALGKLDVRIMKLDAGLPATFRSYNQPCDGIELDAVVDALRALDEVTIQTLFTNGPSGNADASSLHAWMNRLMQISPAAIQIYTLDRGYPSKQIERMDVSELRRIQSITAREGLHAEVYTR